MDYEKMEPHLDKEVSEKYGFRVYIPLFVLVILMLLTKIFKIIPDIGMPLLFVVSAAVGLFTGRRVNSVETIQEALHSSLPVMGILMGVGMFIQVMTLTGVRGFIVMTCLGLPESLRLLASGVSTVWRRIFLWRFLRTRRAVCTGIPEYGYRIYNCGAVLHRSPWRHDAADRSGRPLCG